MQAWLIGWAIKAAWLAGMFAAGWVAHWWDARQDCNTAALQAQIDTLTAQAERAAVSLAIARSSRTVLDNRIEVVWQQTQPRREAIRYELASTPIAAECRLPERVHAHTIEAARAARGRLLDPAAAVDP